MSPLVQCPDNHVSVRCEDRDHTGCLGRAYAPWCAKGHRSYDCVCSCHQAEGGAS